MILQLHLLSTYMMVGISWLIQLLVYPQLILVPTSVFRTYERAHQKRISYVVIPLMICELLTAVWFLWIQWNLFWLTNCGLILLIWLSTFCIQVPLHEKLSQRKSKNKIKRLISTHAIRTFLWSLRAFFLVYFKSL
jgi:hypothetical protein